MAARAITLVKDGRPLATVVVAPEIGETAGEAVRDLVRVIALMSGAALPVMEDSETRVSGPQMHIGRTRLVAEKGLLPEALPVNGYRIVATREPSGPRLVIAGNHSIGISHGIYDLLTRELGVIWGMADPRFEEVPSRRTVKVGPMDRTERPAFSFRVLTGSGAAWNRRNRLEEPLRSLPYYGHGHNLCTVLPPERYADHPEYYALIDGKRQVPARLDPASPQPCLTNPEVIRITVETVRKFFDENPNYSTYSLCPNDTDQFCRCPSCFALDNGMERFRGRRMTSDSYFHYINEVANEVLKTHPARSIGVYAYWTTELPPRRIKRLPPNVVVYLTQDSSQYHDPAFEARDRATLEEWCRVAEHVAIYEYYELGWFLPRYYPTLVARTLRHLGERNVVGVYVQANAFWAHIGPQLYLAARLLWDPTLDKDDVLDEWYRRMFREAAPHVKAYYETLERHWLSRRRDGKWFQGFDWVFEQFFQWPADAREEALNHLNAAYTAAQSEVVRGRLDYVRQGQRFAHLFARAFEHITTIRPDDANLETKLREFAAIVSDAMAAFYIGPGPELLAAYSPIYIEQRSFLWWKAFLGDCLETLLAANAGLRERLLTEDATLAELARIRAGADDDVKMRIGWVYRDLPHLLRQPPV